MPLPPGLRFPAPPSCPRAGGRLLAHCLLAGLVLIAGASAPPAAVSPAAVPVAAVSSSAVPVDGAALARPVRIMPLGDSITFGVGGSTRTGYRADLAARLRAAGVRHDLVGSVRSGVALDRDHEGHPGWRIDQVRARIDVWLAVARPDVVLLNIGTNDYVRGYAVQGAPARASDLIDRILASSPTVRVVVARLVVSAGESRASGIRAFNAVLPAIVAAKGPRVSIADMSRISTRNTTDGVHPNDLGYRQMSFQWFQALRRVLPGGSRWARTADPFPR